MDIQHALNARAVLTLGKDMTFRDYAQGAYRMRGIGMGQTIELLIIPEVPLPPPSRTNWTRLVPPCVLTGHVSSLLARVRGGGFARAHDL